MKLPTKVVNLKTIPGLDEIKADAIGIDNWCVGNIGRDSRSPNNTWKHYTALAEAAASVASPQIRNVGTLGGNLCQRPRCWYYRNPEIICLKKGGDMCYAVDGLSKYHAIFGGGPVYIVHPSDTAPALIALGAAVKIIGPDGERTMPLEEFFILPDIDPQRENVLEPNEVVTEVHVPKPENNTKSFYIKVRERGSFDFALSSVAAAFEMNGSTCRAASIVLGGVAPIPWRSMEAEAALNGVRITESVAKRAGSEAVRNAEPLNDNGYKVRLTQNLVTRAAMKVS